MAVINVRHTPETAPDQGPMCLVCRAALSVRAAYGRKSGKPFVLLVCPVDGRHFRAFIADAKYVQALVDRGVGS